MYYTVTLRYVRENVRTYSGMRDLIGAGIIARCHNGKAGEELRLISRFSILHCTSSLAHWLLVSGGDPRAFIPTAMTTDASTASGY